MTADYIAFHAAERPDALALINNGRAIGFAEFHRDLRKFIQAACELGLPRGSSAAVGCDDYYVHWLLLLALERLGIATASFVDGESQATVELCASVDCVLAAPGFPTSGARRHIGLTQEWLRGAFAVAGAEETGAAPAGPEDPVRILQSSGTTGTPKRIVLLRRMFEARVKQFTAQCQFTARSRYLLTTWFSVWHVYGVATACLRAGGTVVSDIGGGELNVPRAASVHGITHVSLFPIILKHILDGLPPNFVKPPNLTIHSFGAPISEALRERALERLAVELFRNYGCNEAAAPYVSRAPGKDGFGTIWPETTVEIVDDDDRPVPRGEVGRIRLRTPCMVEGYPDDPEATRRHFEDGWFYPEDMGVLNEARQLKVVGRRDEMLNIGGRKWLPAILEEPLLNQEVAGDVAVCSAPNADGIEEIWVAASNARGSDQELLERITREFGTLQLGDFYVIRLDRIPRNANGKIDRALLRKTIARTVHQQ